MFEERLGRPRPQRDDKILAAWNGLMIAAFARMARVLRGLGADGRTAGEPYLDAARRAAAFVREQMWNAGSGIAAAPLSRRPRRDRRLCRRLRLPDLRPARAVPGRPAADVARVGDRAAAAAGRAVLGRGRPAAGSARPASDPSVLLRMKEDYDGAEPTASSVSVLNLLTLSHLVADAQWERSHRADAAAVRDAARADGPRRADDGGGAVHVPRRRPADRDRRKASRATTRSIASLAHAVPAVCDSAARDAGDAARAGRQPAVSSRRCSRVAGVTAAYVCRDFTCRQPVTTVDALEQELGITA